MPSVAYGNTLTDLGRNIAEQKASEQALAGILAQVGASKLAALNALAANRGRTQAERDVGMDRNATTRQVAMLESALRAQELADRERMARESITAAENLARLEGENRLAVAGVPYGPNALELTKALAQLQATQLNPRVQETMFTENADRERMNLRAQSLSTDANRRANLLYQDWITKKASRRWWKPDDSDQELDAAYQTGINSILQNYGEDAALVRPVTQPDGRVIFQPLSLPMIRPQVPQVPVTDTGTTNAVPPPNMMVPQLQGVAPAPPPMVVPRPGVAELRMADEMAVPGVVSGNVANAANMLAGEATALADQSRSILANSPFKELIPPSVFEDASVRGGRRYGARTPDEQESVLRVYVGNLVRERDRLAGMPPNRGSAQRAQLLQSELARVRAILSSQ